MATISAAPRTIDSSRMPLVEHLRALRRALIVSAAAWAGATGLALAFARPLFDELVARSALPGGRVVYLSLAGGVFLDLKVAMCVGTLISAPILIQQAWWFVSPGLHVHERRALWPPVAAAIVFFYAGAGFAFFALPLFVHVLTGLAPPAAEFLPGAAELLSFTTVLIIAFGLVFELPVILYSLGRLGIIDSRWLYRTRPHWFIGLALVANLLTPGVDPVTPLILFVPLWIFWEASALALRLTGR